MPKIFISYRRADAAHQAHNLKLGLDQYPFINPDEVFLDVRESGILPGELFDDEIQRAIKGTDVLLVVIGPLWTKIMKERESHPIDWVRLEIESALKYSKHIIPVLVDDAVFPSIESLPKSIQELCRRNAAQLRVGRDLKQDLDSIANSIHKKFPSNSISYANERVKPKKDFSPGCILARPPQGFQTEESMNQFITEHVGYPCSCMNPQDRQSCAKCWHTWRVKDQYGYRRNAVAFCGKDHRSQSGNFKLNLNLEGLDEMICEAKELGYRVVPCPDAPAGRVIITPSVKPSDEQQAHMARWVKLAQLLSQL